MGDVLVGCISFSISLLLMITITILKEKKIISAEVSRKTYHIAYGFIQVLFIQAYTDSLLGRLISIINISITGVIYLVCGAFSLDGKISYYLNISVSRGTHFREMLYGPLMYCLVFGIFIFVFFDKYPPALIGLMIMDFGDGSAAVVGKYLGRHRLINPYKQPKSIEGAISIVVFGAISSVLICGLFFGEWYFNFCVMASILGSIVEIITPPGFDNMTIPISTLLLGLIIF
ncbi:Phosphatidate cytidylyltransferase [Entamoeba marina]